MTDALTDSTPPTGDPAASTHDRLLSAAATLFAERGYGGTSMADIAEQVGVRKASLYNYYPSKEEILMDLLHRGIDAWAGACAPALEAPGTHGERLWRHLRAAVRFAVDHPEAVSIFRIAATQIGGELGERAMAEVNRHKADHRRALEAFFARAVEAGEVRTADPRELAYVFRMFANGVVTNQLGGCHDDDEVLSDERLRRVWDLFWNGIADGGAA